jgi:hypothetical protein
VEAPQAGLPTVEATVTVDPGRTGVLLSADGEPLSDPAGFTEAIFADDGVRRVGGEGDWVGLASTADPRWQMAVRGSDLVVAPDAPWPYVAGAVLVHRAMCVQPDVLFVHAAAVELGGTGVLLVGAREAGKTTLSVGLAARGHGFLSDEVGAIRLDGPSLLPFPRAAGVRPGPLDSAAEPLLEAPGLPVERFADGSTKTLVAADALNTAPLGEPVPLEHIVILDGLADEPSLTALAADSTNVRYVAPVKSTPVSAASGLKMLRLFKLASAVQWHRLTAGTPQETITLIERSFGGT